MLPKNENNRTYTSYSIVNEFMTSAYKQLFCTGDTRDSTERVGGSENVDIKNAS